MDDTAFFDAQNELVRYGIRLNEEDAIFSSKLANITRSHSFSQSILVPDGNGGTTAYFDYLKSLDNAEDIQKNIEVLDLLTSALTYRLRIKNTNAIEIRNDVNGLHPLLYTVKKEKEKDLQLVPDNASTSTS